MDDQYARFTAAMSAGKKDKVCLATIFCAIREALFGHKGKAMQPSDVEQRQLMIARAAYFLAEKRHFSPGHELEDWLAAERQVDRNLREQAVALPSEQNRVETEPPEETAMEEAFEEAEARLARKSRQAGR